MRENVNIYSFSVIANCHKSHNNKKLNYEVILLADFLKDLPIVFRKRYLDTHGVYLKSIADIIAAMYHTRTTDFEEASVHMIQKLMAQGAKLDEKRQDPGHETFEFRNLRNCWYHECALNYPFKSLDERLRFASWKIMQCYYSVFSSIASLVCCHYPPKKSPNKTLNIYGKNFLCSRMKKRFFLPPTNLYLNERGVIPKSLSETVTWNYAHDFKIPHIEKCLRSVHKESTITTIPHYLKSLREWATYQDAYLMFRLYGESPKEDLDFSLKRIAFIHCLQTEYYLISLFGWEAFERQYKTFSTELRNNLKIESPTLSARINAYQSSKLFA